ncbi:CCA tRNA nucleotidyltransferase [Fodinibius sediminis]|uniref:tRNA nucleotidyltransferase (CCA-adding enzyme) n=1 Tax=Fodinibius sediminis TaxID=1214077 RepID=A0A521ADJ5_9BACT|nr:HD domain-containing protein [Fodinibius sediminis]SMO32851.1 tRNA nucleotidyltransferase (CCA-adding enzyme) [Fodinibius sediminis]
MQDIHPKHNKVFEVISKAGEEVGQDVYVVGGYVRDFYLNRTKEEKNLDIDFVTVGSGIKLARKVADLLGTDRLSVFKQFGTAHIRYRAMDLEFVGARKESYRRDSRKPIVEDGTLQDDQLRRDFTINALSWSLNRETYGQLIDPFGGIQDLKKQLIRTPVDPLTTFDDDPLRMMRAIRFATQLQFDIAKKTYRAIEEMAERIEIISKERIIEELNKIVMAPKPSVGFAHLFKTGLLHHFFPEMVKLHGVSEVRGVRHKDNFWHTLKVLDNVAEMGGDLWLRWAAIMHDIAKPATQKFVKGTGWTFHGHDAVGAQWVKRIFRRLGLPLDERMRYVRKMVRLHLRPIALVSDEVTDSAIRRLIYEAGDDIDDLMTLCRADITSKNDYKVQQYNRNFDYVEQKIEEVEKKDRMRKWKNPITGDEIMEALNIRPGPVIGDIKDAIKEAILDGDIPNEHDAAFEFMMDIKDQYID